MTQSVRKLKTPQNDKFNKRVVAVETIIIIYCLM